MQPHPLYTGAFLRIVRCPKRLISFLLTRGPLEGEEGVRLVDLHGSSQNLLVVDAKMDVPPSYL